MTRMLDESKRDPGLLSNRLVCESRRSTFRHFLVIVAILAPADLLSGTRNDRPATILRTSEEAD